jgi:hypothetical protein
MSVGSVSASVSSYSSPISKQLSISDPLLEEEEELDISYWRRRISTGSTERDDGEGD